MPPQSDTQTTGIDALSQSHESPVCAQPHPPLAARRLDGDEPLTWHGEATNLSVCEFWRWSASALMDNTLRGLFAEFLVASALSQAGGVRTEWDAYDMQTASGAKVEVKSAARWQSWGQSRPSAISFSIASTYAWDKASGAFSKTRRRQADVYVFALLDAIEKAQLNPLELSQWTFFVLPTATLNDHCNERRRLSLKALRALGPRESNYHGLAAAIADAT